jgi:hypothetical protein
LEVAQLFLFISELKTASGSQCPKSKHYEMMECKVVLDRLNIIFNNEESKNLKKGAKSKLSCSISEAVEPTAEERAMMTARHPRAHKVARRSDCPIQNLIKTNQNSNEPKVSMTDVRMRQKS